MSADKAVNDQEKLLLLVKEALEYNAAVVATASAVLAGGQLKRSSYEKLRRQLIDMGNKYVEACRRILEL